MIAYYHTEVVEMIGYSHVEVMELNGYNHAEVVELNGYNHAEVVEVIACYRYPFDHLNQVELEGEKGKETFGPAAVVVVVVVPWRQQNAVPFLPLVWD